MEGLCCYCLDMRVLSQDGRRVDRIKITCQKELAGGKPFCKTEQRKDPPQSRINCDDKSGSVTGKTNRNGSEVLSSSPRGIHPEAASAYPEESFQRVGGNTDANDCHLSSFPADIGSNQRVTSSEHQERVKLKVSLDPVLASCLTSELNRSQAYLDVFTRNFVNHSSFSHARGEGPVKGVIHIKLVVSLTDSSLFSIEPDVRWSKRMLPMWLLRISLDDAFSWLSTLGGAFSALGDESRYFAERAGQVSVHQMKLALQIGDPILQARCMVYLAQSLMQKGYFRSAMCIVRKQYQFALSLGEYTDQRLINMCRGVWSILQYWHQRRREHRKQCMGLHHQPHTSTSIAR